MKINEDIFRSYDIRGIYPDELNETTAELVGKALGTKLTSQNKSKVVVGRDNRKSSPILSERLIKGLLSTGCDVTYVSITLTPIIHFLTCIKDFDLGVNVTASHNPKQFNGFRIDYKNAQPFYGVDIKDILDSALKEKFVTGDGKYREEDLNRYYFSYFKKKFNFKRHPKVLIDCGSGATSEIAGKLFDSVGCDVQELYCDLNDNFPRDIPDPERKLFMDELEAKVKNTKVDLGFAFDTDGDRFGVVDELGNSYDNDRLLLLFAKDLLIRKPGSEIVYDVKCSLIVDSEIRNMGGNPIMMRTGHPYFMEAVAGTSMLGAEFSGHSYFAEDYFGYDDGIYAGCKVLDILEKNPSKTLSQLMSCFPKTYHTNEIKIACEDKNKFEVIKKMKIMLSTKDKRNHIYDIDGLRVQMYDDSWFLVRVSNTSPYLSVRLEAKHFNEAKKVKEFLLELLADHKILDLLPLKSACFFYS